MKFFFNGLIFLLFFQKITFGQGLNLPFISRFDTPDNRSKWQEFRLGKQHENKWNFSTSMAFSEPFCLFHDYPNNASALDTIKDWIVSPPLDMSYETVISFELILFCAGGKTNYSDYFGIWGSHKSNNPVNGDFKELANLSHFAQNQSKWSDVKLIIPPQADSLFVAFVYKCSNNWLWVNIDNLEIVNYKDWEENDRLVNKLIKFENPHSQSNKFILPSNYDSEFVLNVYDIQGKCTISQKIKKGKNSFKKKLDPGVYQLKIINNYGEIEQKQNIVITK